MSGTLQLLTHVALAGIGLGIAIATLPDAGWLRFTVSSVFWFTGYFHFADALWIPSWGKGRDSVDRFGIAIKGVGFILVAAAPLARASLVSFLLTGSGLLVMLFGRILWELAIAGRKAT